jgi:predicted O-linked N-acetylglucosamine transferase (SPINDLY family)
MPTPSPYAAASLALAHQHLSAGRAREARALLERAIESEPDSPELRAALALACAMNGANHDAIPHFDRALALSPDDPALLTNYAKVLIDERRHDRAIELLERAREIAQRTHADDPSLAINLCAAYRGANRPVAALEAIEPTGERSPSHPAIALARATCWFNLGHAQKAADVLREAIRANPDRHDLRSLLCATLNYIPGVSPADLLAAHRQYADTLSSLWPAPARRDRPPRDASRPLRVGFVSGDLFTHSVSYFLLPLLRHLDRSRVFVACYSMSGTIDGATADLRAHADLWRDAGALNLAALRAAIAEDAIDVLIDLSGHMQRHRLVLFHARAAPVQATWLGYPATTGVRDMDFRLVDSTTDPAGSESHASESLVRLDPCFLCYESSRQRPEPVPRQPEEPIVFASFNNLQKLNEPLLRLWGRVLDAAPGSFLALKSRELRSPEAQRHTIARWASLGLPVERLRVLPGTPTHAEHLRMYDAVDIALDTYPYHGTTTTCEALSMGVPVVTLLGDRHAARVGASILRAIGMEECIAPSEDEYVRIASDLARDRARLAALRASLPARLPASPLCDAPAFARRFADAMHQMSERAAREAR